MRRDNSRFWASVLITPLWDEMGELRGFGKVTRDITARRSAEALLAEKMNELSRSNEELAQFATVASHDLQEPLRMVCEYIKLLSRRYKGKLDADADEFIAFALDGASRMQRLIKDLLTYSRVGTTGVELHNTSSEKSLQQAIANLRGAIAGSGALVTHDPLPVVMADEMQLSQLFQNLIGNAIKYQKLGIPKIHVSAVMNGEKKWNFSVRDNGIGIESTEFRADFRHVPAAAQTIGVRRHRHRTGDLQKNRRAARRQHFGRVATRARSNLSFCFGRGHAKLVRSAGSSGNRFPLKRYRSTA